MDLKFGNILMANAKATELTAYTRRELCESKLSDVFSQYSVFNLTGLASQLKKIEDVEIKQRNGTTIKIDGLLTGLGGDRNWGLITFEYALKAEKRISQEELAQQRWAALLMLIQAFRIPGHHQAITQILQAGQLLTGAGSIAYYEVEPDAADIFSLRATRGNAEIFPAMFQRQEISELDGFHIWETGSRAKITLHKKAIAAKQSYLAISILDSGATRVLALSDAALRPDDELEIYLELIGTAISTISAQEEIEQQIKARANNQSPPLSPTLLENLKEGIIFVSTDLKVMDLNAAAELTLGYSANEIKGQGIENILITSESLLPALRSAQTGVATQNLGDIQLLRRDGQSLLTEVKTVPLIAAGEVQQIAILISDISENEEMRTQKEQLEQQAVLGEVTAIFAHEVRNPINNLSTTLQLMALKFPDDDPIQEQIEGMQEDCNRLTDLMKSVLAFSGPREYKMEPVDLGAFIKKLLSRWHPRMSRYKIHHHLQVDPGVPPVMGDPRALEQVFTNLITNAIQAMKESGGILTLKIQPGQAQGAQGMVEAIVSDNGPGIPEDVLEQIFRPFFTTHEQGTGLGLTITKRIVSAHKGRIDVRSFPGGTIFQILLPIADNTL